MALTTNLIRYFKCEDNAASIVVTDSTGNANGASARNTSSITTTGKIANSFDFVPASSDYILDGSPPDFSGTNPFSVSLWIYSDSNADCSYFWYTPNNSTSNIKIQQFTDNKVYFERGGVSIGLNITTGAWTHYVMTYDGTNLIAYKNGIATSTGDTNSLSSSTNILQFGRKNTSGSLFYDGKMDEIGVWSRALSAEEVKRLYNGNGGLTYDFTDGSIVFLGTTGSTTNNTDYTFPSVNLGIADTSRKIIVGVRARQVAGGTIGSDTMTIAGVSATQIQTVYAGGDFSAIWIADVPTGTSGDIVVNLSAEADDCDIAVYSALHIGSTATDSGTSTANPLTYDLDIGAKGVAVAMGRSQAGGATATWAGLIETYDGLESHGNDWSGAFGNFYTEQTNLTVSCTWSSSSNPNYVVASFPYEAPVTTNIKSKNGLAYASIKSFNGLAKASVKSVNGLA